MMPSDECDCLKLTFSYLTKWICRTALSKKMNAHVSQFLFPPLMKLEKLSSHLLKMIVEKMDFNAQCSLIRTSKFGKYCVDSFGPEIERIVLTSQNNSFGIMLYYPNEDRGPYFVKDLNQDGVARQDGRLRPGDEIIAVNKKRISHKNLLSVKQLFNSRRRCILVIRRHKSFLYREDAVVMKDLMKQPFWRERKKPTEFEVKLIKTDNIFGMTISSTSSPSQAEDFAIYSHYVISIVCGSQADGKLKVGDQILSADGRKLEDKSSEQIPGLFGSLSEVRLLIERRG